MAKLIDLASRYASTVYFSIAAFMAKLIDLASRCASAVYFCIAAFIVPIFRAACAWWSRSWSILVPAIIVALIGGAPGYYNWYKQLTAEGKPDVVVMGKSFSTRFVERSVPGHYKADIIVELRNVGDDDAVRIHPRFEISYGDHTLDDSRVAATRIGRKSSPTTIKPTISEYWYWPPDTVVNPRRQFCEVPKSERKPIRLSVDVNWQNERGRIFTSKKRFTILCVLQEGKTPVYLWYDE